MQAVQLGRSVLALGVTALLSLAHAADPYPNRPVRLVVGFGAGGTADAIARYTAQKLSETYKVSFVVDNKPGAGQILAIRTLQGAPADGYTLFMATASALSQGPGVREVSYDPIKDFAYIGLVASVPGVFVVNAQLPIRTVGDLVKYVRANPAAANYASSGVGAASHLQTEYLLSLAGIKMTHIPYKADAEIMRVVSDGSVQLGLTPIPGAMAGVAGGRVRAIAVTGSKRVKALPDVPPLSEADVKGLQGVDPYSYYGLLGLPALPASIVTQLNEALNRIARQPEVITHMQDRLYAEASAGTPDAFRDYVQKDLVKWKAFARHVKFD